jgi:hypothetical protein
MNQPVDQTELRQALDRMVAAFNQFHTEMDQLRHRQRDLITQIRTRLDQQKIEEIQELLKNAKQ